MTLFRISAVLLLSAAVGAAQAQTITRDSSQTDTSAKQSQSESMKPQSRTDMQSGDRDASMASEQDTKADTASAPATAPTGTVAREQFTSAINHHEPTDSLDSVSVDQGKVYFFTDLRDFAGQTVTHRWMHDGKDVADVDFQVGGPRWRVWSSKRLNGSMTGQWTVQVVGENGSVIDSQSLNVTEATPAASMDESDETGMKGNMDAAPSEPANMESTKGQNDTDTTKDEMEPVTPPSDDKNGG